MEKYPPKAGLKKVQPEGYMWPAADSPDYASGTVCVSLITGIHMRNNTLSLKLK
jgi:hypothetical protein